MVLNKAFFKKIIVAVNGRQSSVQAAMYGIMMAKIYKLELKFVCVVDTATIKLIAMNHLFVSNEKIGFEEKLTEDGERYLSYVEKLAEDKGVKCEKELRKGGVFTEILKAAEEFEADLILLGGNIKESGKTGIKKSVFNEEQNSILANSGCPVMIVQKPDIEAEFKIFK